MANKNTEALKPKINLLDIIYQLESSSGQNKKAYKENKYGALGGYQIRRSTFNVDLKANFPKKWGKKKFEDVAMDDALSREAATDYLKVIGKFLISNNMAPIPEALLASYHSGMGTVSRGKPLGEEGMDYLKKARQLRGIEGDEPWL